MSKTSSISPHEHIYPSADACGESCFPVEEEQVGGDEVGENQDEDQQGGEESGEVQASRKVSQPRAPSAEERREHELTHCPYRCWCEHCVRGQGSEYKHSTVMGSNAGSEVPRAFVDDCFLFHRRR